MPGRILSAVIASRWRQVPSDYTASYWQGAVEFSAGASLKGASPISGPFTKGVLSFWTKDFPASGSLSISQIPPQSTVSVTMDQQSVNLSLIDKDTQQTLVVASMNHQQPTGWHHYICSWDASQSVASADSDIHKTFTFAVAGDSFYNEGANTDGLYTVIVGLVGVEVVLYDVPQLAPFNSLTLLTYKTKFPADGLQNVTASSPSGVSSTVFSATYSDPIETYGAATWDLTGWTMTLKSDPTVVYTASAITDIVRGSAIGFIVKVDCTRQLGSGPANVIKAQWAMDRGGPGGVGPPCDTDAANINAQPMSRTGGNGLTGTLSTTGDFWQITTTVVSDFAYCYFGIGKSFFDLTSPSNLNYFISPNLLPVNFGFAGRNIPLACDFMHTGNAGTLNVTPELYDPSKIYLTSDPALPLRIPVDSDWVTYKGLTYYALAKNGHGTSLGIKIPDQNPAVWQQAIFPLGQPQFQYNAATGFAWPLTGNMVTAPTQPPFGV